MVATSRSIRRIRRGGPSSRAWSGTRNSRRNNRPNAARPTSSLLGDQVRRRCLRAPASGVKRRPRAPATRRTILSVIRQVRYSARNGNEIDLVLFVNGVPVVTIEIKNQADPARRCAMPRSSTAEIGRRPTSRCSSSNAAAVVHFALDDDNVSMTTRTARTARPASCLSTVGGTGGAGNPEIPRATSRVGYLWADQPDMPARLLARGPAAEPWQLRPPRQRRNATVARR